MPPKKKGNKKQQDDWESELGETIDPIAQATQGAKDAEAANDAEQNGEEEPEDGLMARLRKRAKKGKKGAKADNDFVDGEEPTNGDTESSAPEPVDLSNKAPEEATMDDEDVFGQPMKKGKKGGKQDQKKADADEDGDEEETGEGGRVLTKKEKEKLKKEREKQRKKEQAALKKKAPGAQPAKNEEKAAEPEAAPEVAAPAPVEAPAAGGKKKKLPAALAALQKQQEELKKRQEEEARAREEEKRQEEEAKKAAEEEEKRQAEQRAARKAKDKAKIEQMKKEGKYMTKAQKEADARAKARLQQMIESGATVAGLDDNEAEKADKRMSERDRRKKNPKKAAEEARMREEAEAAAKAEEDARKKMEELRIQEDQTKAAEAAAEEAKANALSKKAEEEDELEDWEAEADKADEDLKDSWDAESDGEGGELVKSSANGKPVQAGANGSKADIVSANKKQPNGTATKADSDSDSEEDSSEEESSDEEDDTANRRAAAVEKRKKVMEEARKNASADNLRSPICCILGHVDTGKTKLLDKVRQTNVQEGEAGGITQQIGATYFPVDALQKKIAVINQDNKFELKVPGLLVIDTPGHESFSNLRSRGSSLCNIAILVVDIMHGLEPQTLESMKLLRDRKTPFIVALNKIDRLYGWKKIDNNGFRESLALQNKGVQNEFKDRLEKTKLAFAEKGFNSEVFYENKSMARNVSLVPTSAHTGEGIPDMLKLLVQLTQERMTNQLMYLSEVECTVLEVKVIEGLGTTIDVVLSNGILREGDRIMLCGNDGSIIKTDIRALLTPAEMKELRVKSQYVHNKEVKAALGVKITANGLENAIAGSRLLVVGPDDDEDDLEDDLFNDLDALFSKTTKSGRGVYVQASTLGSLEALLEFLKQMKIPVGNIGLGPVHRRNVITASAMLEKAKQYAIMLCFDVKIEKEAQQYADDVGVKVFTADIIYHLFDNFKKHMEELTAIKKEESKMLAVFPCVLGPISVFNKKDPIVVGVDVTDGSLRVNTPIAAVVNNPVTNVKTIVPLGRV